MNYGIQMFSVRHYAEVLALAKELGLAVVVESDTCTPSGIEAAKISYDYLRSVEATL